LEFTIIENKDFSPQRDVKTVYYDFNEVVFPLKISLWHSGDVFLPFGAKGKKKISDLLTDKKLNLVEKQRVRVLRSGEKIIWVIGLRASNYFRVTDKTKKILKITLIE
jgi:tRNA(Ile)-lysidine synthase